MAAATPAVSRTEKELREAILEQTARVRKLKLKPEMERSHREGVERSEGGGSHTPHHQQSQGTGNLTGTQRNGQTTPEGKFYQASFNIKMNF